MIQKFKHAIKKELLIYLVMLIIFAILMHSDLLSDPALRFQTMGIKENYSHPFVYSFVIYIIILIIRKTIDFVSAIFERK